MYRYSAPATDNYCYCCCTRYPAALALFASVPSGVCEPTHGPPCSAVVVCGLFHVVCKCALVSVGALAVHVCGRLHFSCKWYRLCCNFCLRLSWTKLCSGMMRAQGFSHRGQNTHATLGEGCVVCSHVFCTARIQLQSLW